MWGSASSLAPVAFSPLPVLDDTSNSNFYSGGRGRGRTFFCSSLFIYFFCHFVFSTLFWFVTNCFFLTKDAIMVQHVPMDGVVVHQALVVRHFFFKKIIHISL